LLLLVLLIGFGLRIWQISKVPPSLGNDEISIAYDAYSVSTIGKDSAGAFLPLSFKSHGTYKAPLYAYIAGPFIKLLGNNELSVRFPSVILGTLAILFLYLLIEEISRKRDLALISSFVLAIAPWHVYTSRIALEANIALTFLILGVYLFFLGRTKWKYLILSSLSLALSLYAYHTEWVFVPLLMLFLYISYQGNFKNRQVLFGWILLFVVLVLPLGLNWLSIRNETNRATTEIIFNDLFLANRLSGVINPLSRVFIFLSFWTNKYLSYLSLDYIFTNGLPVSASYSSPEFGLLNLLELPLFILGIFQIAKSKDGRSRNLWIYWGAIGALVSSFTLGELNLTRYLVTIIPLVVVVAYGIIWIRENAGKRLFYLSIALILINFIFFYKYYIKLFPFHFSENWQYGYKQAAQYIKDNESKYDRVIIDPAFGVADNKYKGVPNIYLLYFNKMNPQLFLDTKKSGKETLEFMNKYYIRKVDWTTEKIQGKSLYVVSVHSMPLLLQRVREVYSINILDGTKAFKIYEGY